jgi:hypothetical protein
MRNDFLRTWNHTILKYKIFIVSIKVISHVHILDTRIYIIICLNAIMIHKYVYICRNMTLLCVGFVNKFYTCRLINFNNNNINKRQHFVMFRIIWLQFSLCVCWHDDEMRLICDELLIPNEISCEYKIYNIKKTSQIKTQEINIFDICRSTWVNICMGLLFVMKLKFIIILEILFLNNLIRIYDRRKPKVIVIVYICLI